MSRTVKIPEAMLTPRFKAPKETMLPEGSEIPLINPDDPDHKKVQERLVAHAKVFDLSVDTERIEYEQVWQAVCDGQAQVSQQEGPTWDGTKGRYVSFMRWSTFQYIAPHAAS